MDIVCWSMVYGLGSMVYGLGSMVYGLGSMGDGWSMGDGLGSMGDGHAAVVRASATTWSAASPIEFAVVKFSPLSFNRRLPSSTLVPSMRITIGTRTPSS